MSRIPPNGGRLWDQVSKGERHRLGQWNKTTNISPTEYGAAAALGPVENPLAAVPLAAEAGTFMGKKTRAYEMLGFFGDGLDDHRAASMEYYSWDDAGFLYENFAEEMEGSIREDAGPAPITISPTSTTNPDRPRTVAAGYDPAQQKLTVIFRDGTYYNYFEVTAAEWKAFRAIRSKGKYIREVLDWGRPRGVADVATIPTFARDTVYRFLRTGQTFRNGVQQKKTGSYKTGSKATDLPRIKPSRGQFGGSGGNLKK